MNTKAADPKDSFEVSDEAKLAQEQHQQNEETVSDNVEVGELETEEVTESTEDSNEDEVTSTDSEVQQLKDQLIRVMADNQNIKRRSEADRLRFFEESKARYINMFLPIYDDLSRSVAMSETIEVPEAFLNGIKLVTQKFDQIFEREKVERIDKTLVPFDVDVHEALMRQPAPDDTIAPDTVLQVFEPGYKIGGKVIKHAKVIVSE